MVDGSSTQGQESGGTFPIEFRQGPRRELPASQPCIEFIAALKPLWKSFESPTKDESSP